MRQLFFLALCLCLTAEAGNPSTTPSRRSRDSTVRSQGVDHSYGANPSTAAAPRATTRTPAKSARARERAAGLPPSSGSPVNTQSLYDLATRDFNKASPNELAQRLLKSIPRSKLPIPQSAQAPSPQPNQLPPNLQDANSGERAAGSGQENEDPESANAHPSKKPPKVAPVAKDEDKQRGHGKAPSYVEDRFSFNKLDVQASPGENVAERGSNPAVDAKRLQKMQRDTYRPGKLYVKTAGATAPALQATMGSDSQPKSGAAPRTRSSEKSSDNRHCANRLYDLNKDGKVSREERLRCVCSDLRYDTNKDGKVSTDERRQCKAA